MERVRGTCVAVDGWAVLLRGRSGAGKSDLALRLIESGAQLVADDYTIVAKRSGVLVASAPSELRGLLEVRGIGIVPMPAADEARLIAVVDLVDGADVERMPEYTMTEVLGVRLPLFRLVAFEASAVAKVRLAARVAGGRTALIR